MTGLRKLGAYGGVLYLAGSALDWKRSMERHLVEGGVQAAKAAQMASLGGSKALQAQSDAELVVAAETEGESMEANAKVAQAKAAEDEAQAAEEEHITQEQATKAEEEQALAETEEVEGGAFETAAELDRAEGALEAEEAVRSEIAAHSDEATTALCEFIPLLDIVCDVVGGVGAASLETSAAAEAAKSVADLAAAAAVQVEADGAFAAAAELETASVADGGLATESEASAARLEVQAEQEEAEARADSVLAKEKEGEAEAEEAKSEEEEAESVVDEKQSSSAMTKAMEQAVLASRDGILSLVVGIVTLAGVSVRLTLGTIVPHLSRSVTSLVSQYRGQTFVQTSTRLLHHHVEASQHVVHHLFCMILSVALFGRILGLLGEQASMGMRLGVAILGFPFTAATLQASLVPPGGYQFIELIPWCATEPLLLIMWTGRGTLASVSRACHPIVVVLLWLPVLAAHHIIYKRQNTASVNDELVTKDMNVVRPDVEQSEHSDEERQSLLLASSSGQNISNRVHYGGIHVTNDIECSTINHVTERPWGLVLEEYLEANIQLPCELLLVSWIFNMLRPIGTNLWKIWPHTKDAVLPWIQGVGGAVGLLAVAAIVALLVAYRLQQRHATHSNNIKNHMQNHPHSPRVYQ